MVSLNNLIGQPLTTQLELTTIASENEKQIAEMSSSISTAQKDRPDVKANELRALSIEKNVDIAHSGWYPMVSANASYLFANPNQRIFPAHDKFDGTWSVGINLSWDLWNWMLPSHQAAQAQAQLAQSRENISAQKDGIAVEVMQNYLALSPSKERISVAETAVNQATENYKVVSNKYKAGSSTSTEVIEAETLLMQSKVNKISAIVDYELSVARLNRSLGK